jgi:hypothetical protein
MADLPLFSGAESAPVERPPMARRRDPETSHQAAAAVLPKVHSLHEQVLSALAAAGPDGLNDRQLEQLPQFAKYGPSTIRKRRSELYQLGYVTHNGTRDGLMVWVRVPGAPHP